MFFLACFFLGLPFAVAIVAIVAVAAAAIAAVVLAVVVVVVVVDVVDLPASSSSSSPLISNNFFERFSRRRVFLRFEKAFTRA